MPPTVAELIGHPERLNKESLYGLREIVARYPYYQTARLLFLKNLFLLHDDSFGEELRKAALCMPNRRVLFKMVEGRNYEAPSEKNEVTSSIGEDTSDNDRTQSLIDRFLQSDKDDEEHRSARKPTAADAATNYVAFLMELDDINPVAQVAPSTEQRNRRSRELIDDFIEHKPTRIVLQDTLEYSPAVSEQEQEQSNEEDYFTETLAKIYIKQGRYEKAMEIIRKLNLNYPKKNRYFADQMRFLQKLIINNKHKT